MATKILVVEDEPELLHAMTAFLLKRGYEALGIPSADTAFSAIDTFRPDVLLLDKKMPGQSGDEFIHNLRLSKKFSDLSVIMISGCAHEDEICASFDLGVDDYVTKPFSMKELESRIVAVQRRRRKESVTSKFSINQKARAVTVQGICIALTLTEYNVLSQLYESANEVQSRAQIREKALSGQFISDRTLDVHMTALRKKLGPVGPMIKTVRGVGFMFTDKTIPQEN